MITVLCSSLLLAAAQTSDQLDTCAQPPVNSQLCHCDEECGLFGDCCPRCEITTSRSNEGFFSECRSTYLDISIVPGENEAFWMVSACPETWGDSGLEETFIEGNCTDGASNLPPVSDTTTGQIYRNEYCAVCNRAMGIIAWRYQLVCSENLAILAAQPGFVLTREILDRECDPCSFVQPELSINDSVARTCYPHIASCLEQSVLTAQTDTPFNNVSYNNLVEQCTTNSGPYSLISTDSNVTPFRNQYCAMCNGINTGLSCYTPPVERHTCTFMPASVSPMATTISPGPTGPPGLTDQITTTNPIGLPGPIGPAGRPGGRPDTPPPTTNIVIAPTAQSIPFSLVLDIRGDGLVVVTSSEITTTITVTCSEGEVFHPPSGECHRTICPEGFTQTGGSCTYVPSFGVTTLDSGSVTSDGNCSHGLRRLDESEYQEVGNNTVLFGDELVEILMMDSAGRPVVCVNFTGNETIVSLNCPAGEGLLSLNDSQLYEDLGNNSVLFDGEVVKVVFNGSGTLLVCAGQRVILNCPAGESLLSLNDSQLYENLGNNSILFSGEVFEIVFNGSGTVSVCAPQNGTIEVNTTLFSYQYPAAYFILTYIGCSFSVIGTVLILLTYCLFKDLRSLPSKLLMNLAATILMSSLFILIGGPITAAFPNVNLCTSVAVILHFFFLAQFSWMSVMSFEMARTFNQALKLRTRQSNRFKQNLFITYFLIGWGLPLLVTIISITVNFTTNGLVLYGVRSDGTQWLCRINHLESAIVAFVIPVCLSLLFNFTTFIVVSVYLFMASRAQDKVEKYRHVSYLRINLAIFIASGLTWVFGFIAILVGTDWVWYVFIILNSGLGFVIFIAFLCTKKVLILYMSLLHIRLPESADTSTSVKQPAEPKKGKWMYQSNSSNGTSISDTNVQHESQAV